MKEILR